MMEMVIGQPEGVEIREDNGRIVEYVRRGKVRGFQPIPDDPIDDDRAALLILNDAAFPQPGAELLITTHNQQSARRAYLMERGIRFLDSNNAEVTLTYRHFGDVRDDWEVDVSLAQEDTIFDRTGTEIPDLTHNADKQGATVPVLVPRLVLKKEYVRVLESGETNISIAKKFSGKVNKSTWKGSPPGAWLVTDFRVSTISHGDNGADRVCLVGVQIELKVNGQYGHQPVLYYTDSQSGKKASGLTLGEGYFPVYVYNEVDFAAEFGL